MVGDYLILFIQKWILLSFYMFLKCFLVFLDVLLEKKKDWTRIKTEEKTFTESIWFNPSVNKIVHFNFCPFIIRLTYFSWNSLFSEWMECKRPNRTVYSPDIFPHFSMLWNLSTKSSLHLLQIAATVYEQKLYWKIVFTNIRNSCEWMDKFIAFSLASYQ